MATFRDAIEFIQLNDLDGFDVRASTSDNSTIFKYDSSVGRDQNLSRLQKIMSFTRGHYFFLKGWKGANQNRGAFSFEFENNGGQDAPAAVGTATGYSDDYVKNLIAVEVEKVKFDFAQKDLERRERELREERKKFLVDRDSVIGTVVNKFAPLLQKMMPRVAGIDDPDRQVTIPQAPEQDEATPAEVEKIQELLQRWANVDDDFMALLEKIVLLAESQDPKYNMAKSMI